MKTLRLVLIYFFILACNATTFAQSYFNKLIDFGFFRNSLYAVEIKGPMIQVHGRSQAMDTSTTTEIFYSELTSHGEVEKFLSLDRGKFITNNLINDIVSLDGNYISSFSENKSTILFKIQDDNFEILDTFSNSLDPDRTYQITKFFQSTNDDISYSGSYSRILQNSPLVIDSRIFYKSLGSNIIDLEVVNPVPQGQGGELVPLDSGYFLRTIDRNGSFPVPDEWGAEVYFFHLDDSGLITESYKSEPDQHLNSISDIEYLEGDKFIVIGLEAKADPNGSSIVIRTVVYKFSFQNGIEWKTYPLGDQWESSFDRVIEIIPSVNPSHVIVLGQEGTTDSLGTYQAVTLSEISNEGELKWTKYYNSGHNALHNGYDIARFNDGYIVVGDVFNFPDGPPGDAQIYGWMFHVNKNGDFDEFSVTTEPLTELDIAIYPNPSANEIKILYSENIKVDKVTVSDISGSMYIQSNSDLSSIDIYSLPIGTYVINFYHGNRFLGYKKFIKN